MQTNNLHYQTFLDRKAQNETDTGFSVSSLPNLLFDFQAHLVEWNLRKGRSATFADCGLGKTPMQLVWAQKIVERTNGRVLIVAPLAVVPQTAREAEKFSIEAKASKGGELGTAKTIITNYEQLHHYDPKDFIGMVCDESSILKNFDGVTKAAITAFMLKMSYRLLCTATAAPNDYVELGTSSEALGYLGYMDMLGMFFKNDENTLHSTHSNYDIFNGGKFRFKRHAEQPFWRWLCSWARAIRKPSDLGFSDKGFVLPDLHTDTHILPFSRPLDGYLFAMPAVGLAEQRQERSATVTHRCEKAAAISAENETSIAWCHLNSEGDLLTKLIPDSVQVSGKDSDEEKVEKFEAFQSGQIKRLITKPSIAAFGLNWQHCNHMTFFPSHSFEQYYQAVRRCWRFGQKSPVTVDIVTTQGEADVFNNLQRKAKAAEQMFSSLVSEMNNELKIDRSQVFQKEMSLPAWL